MCRQPDRHDRDQIRFCHQERQSQKVRGYGLQPAAQPVSGEEIVDQPAVVCAIENRSMTRQCKLAQRESFLQQWVSAANDANVLLSEQIARVCARIEPTHLREKPNGCVESTGAQVGFGAMKM